jgi:RimJ/RimL family protein N-acetyltransferase
MRVSDLPAQAAMMGDPVTARFLGGTPLSREDTWRKMLTGPAMWDWMGYGYWSVERRADSAVIGQIGFADFKRDIMPSVENIPEMGWAFAREAGGQGYASEAAAAALAWADTVLNAAEVVAIIDAENERSIRIAEKSGFSVREEALYRGEPILLFRRRI